MRSCIPVSLAVLLLPLAVSFAAGEPATRPEPSPSGDTALPAFHEAFESIELLGIRGGVRPAEVDEVLNRTAPQIEAARKALAGRLEAADKTPVAANRPGRGGAQDAQRIREQLCSVELLVGDLYCAAAGVLGPAEGKSHADRAIQVYRTARVDYRDVAVSVMGYIGESKVFRHQKRYADARSALDPVFDITRKGLTPVQAEVGRIAALENLEVLLAESPTDALREATAWRSGRTVTQDEQWSARADWLIARAGVAMLESTPASLPDSPATERQVQETLALLRSAVLGRVTSSAERLAAIVRLERAWGRPLMTAAEAAAWADTLTRAGSADAARFYSRAAAAGPASMPVDSALRFAALLVQDKAFAKAADFCTQLAQRDDLTAGQRTLTLRFASACRVQMFRDSPSPADAERHGRAAAQLLLKLARSDIEPEVHREALRQWVEVIGRLDGLAACVDVLEGARSVVEEDSWLLYSLAAARWELVRSRAPSGTSAPASRPADELVSLLQKARRPAADPGAAELQARIVLLQATIRSSPPLSDNQGALRTLLESWEALLQAGPDLRSSAVHLRLRLLVELGLTEDALALVDALPAEVVGGAGDAILSLASILADRLEATGSSGRDAERARIRSLCQKAVAHTVGQAESYDSHCLSAARILLRAGAGRDARALLEGRAARKPQAGTPDSTAVQARLLTAEAFAQEGNINEAIAICDKLSEQAPADHQVLMTRGRLGLAADNPGQAAAWFRKAREARTAGSQPWCEATLGLAESMLEEERKADAAGLLRVSLALYPDFGNPQLLASANRLRARAEGAGPPG